MNTYILRSFRSLISFSNVLNFSACNSHKNFVKVISIFPGGIINAIVFLRLNSNYSMLIYTNKIDFCVLFLCSVIILYLPISSINQLFFCQFLGTFLCGQSSFLQIPTVLYFYFLFVGFLLLFSYLITLFVFSTNAERKHPCLAYFHC